MAPLLNEKFVRDESCAPRRYDNSFSMPTSFGSIFNLLARVELTTSKSEMVTDRTGKKLAPSEELPAEIVALILADGALDKTGVLSLGVCSRTLWMYALHHIEDVHRKSVAPWAGTPLIYTGTYMIDIPPVFLAHYPELKNEQTKYDERSSGMCPARSWNWGMISSSENVAEKDHYYDWRQALQSVLPVETDLFSQLAQDLDEALGVDADRISGKWYLRDLTVKEYVSLDVDGREPGEANATVQDMPFLKLEEALLMQIRWSAPAGFDIDYKGKGSWVGHSFDIVREKPAGNGWRDVTALVGKAATGSD